MSRSLTAQLRYVAGRRAPRLTLAIGFTAILALSAGMVAGAIPNSGTGVINGCYEKNTGLLRVIDTQAGKTCTRWETPISWSQAGPRGEAGRPGENGQDGTNGLDGEDGADGTNGLDGLDGTNGSDGLNGNSVLNGTSNPSDDAGVPGDFYIDTATWTLYGPKTEAGWGEGVSLVGPQGLQGLQGPQGPQGAQGPQGPAGPGGGGSGGGAECTGTAPIFANATTACVGGTWIYQCSGTWADVNASSADGCEIDTATDAQHCGGMQLDLTALASTPGMNVTSALCVSGQPQLVCDSGYEDVLVDGTLDPITPSSIGGARLDGCESALRADGLIVHDAGTGLTYAHALPRGTPGSASTYSAAMAHEAAKATRDLALANNPEGIPWHIEFARDGYAPWGSTSCGGSVYYLQAAGFQVGVVWVYEGPLAGQAFHSDFATGELSCNSPVQTTWN